MKGKTEDTEAWLLRVKGRILANRRRVGDFKTMLSLHRMERGSVLKYEESASYPAAWKDVVLRSPEGREIARITSRPVFGHHCNHFFDVVG